MMGNQGIPDYENVAAIAIKAVGRLVKWFALFVFTLSHEVAK